MDSDTENDETCKGDGKCLTECICRYIKGTNYCNCYNYNHIIKR